MAAGDHAMNQANAGVPAADTADAADVADVAEAADAAEAPLEEQPLGRAARRRAEAVRVGEGTPQEGVAIFRPVELAVLVALHAAGETSHDVDASLDELELLVDTAGSQTVGRLVHNRNLADVATFICRGNVATSGTF